MSNDVEIHYDPDHDLLIETFRGPLSVELIARARRLRREQGLDHAVGRAILDLRGITAASTREEFERFERDAPSEELPGRRVALLVSDQRLTAFAMMWARIVSDHLEAEVFSTPSAACAWLGVESAEGDLPA